jgi:hypothetical protein
MTSSLPGRPDGQRHQGRSEEDREEAADGHGPFDKSRRARLVNSLFVTFQ